MKLEIKSEKILIVTSVSLNEIEYIETFPIQKICRLRLNVCNNTMILNVIGVNNPFTIQCDNEHQAKNFHNEIQRIMHECN
jgi:hypothetical protein